MSLRQPLTKRACQLSLCAGLVAGLLAAPLPSSASAEAPAPAPAPAASAYLADLKAKARREHIAESRAWLALGHYLSTWVGGKKTEVAGPEFFLSATGPTDPIAELEATLDAFAGAPRKQDAPREEDEPQCRFPARRRFLYEALAIDRARLPWRPCPALEAWKRRLGADGISLVFASAYLNNAASMFGHSFLKFHGRDNSDDRDLLNYGVSFAADSGRDGGASFAIRGLFGGYRGYFSLLPYHQTLHTYSNLEGRDIWEYRLALSPAEVDFLVDHLLELKQTWFDYYFVDKNCSYQLLAALEAARPSLRLTSQFSYWAIPADAVRVVARSPGLVVAKSYRPSLATEFAQARARLDGAQAALAKALVADPPEKFDAALAALASTNADLPARARVLDAALLYAATLGAGDEGDNALASAEERSAAGERKARDYRLKLARASLGLPSEPFNQASARARPPEDGHDSSLAALGLGQREGFAYQSLEARAAYHSLLSNDTGFLPNTRLEALRARILRSDALGGAVLQELALADLLAMTPWTRFARPLSWAATIGWQRLPERPAASSLAFSLKGGIGAAVEPLGGPGLALAAFALANGDAADDLDKGYRLGASAQALALLRMASWWHASLGAEYTYFVLGATSDFPAFWAKQAISLSRNWEARLDLSRAGSIADSQAVIAWHFLF